MEKSNLPEFFYFRQTLMPQRRVDLVQIVTRRVSEGFTGDPSLTRRVMTNPGLTEKGRIFLTSEI